MSVHIFDAGGILREQWDDTTRTYTSWDAEGVQKSTRPYTVEENAQADEDARQNAMITDLEGRVTALEQYVFAVSPPDPDGAPWTATDWPPGAVVTHAGKTWTNQTGQWLNGNYVPGDPQHPFWSEKPTNPVVPWAAGMHLIPNMFVSNGGHVYQYKGTDTPSAPPNWAPTGTVSTATWMFIS